MEKLMRQARNRVSRVLVPERRTYVGIVEQRRSAAGSGFWRFPEENSCRIDGSRVDDLATVAHVSQFHDGGDRSSRPYDSIV